MFRLQNINRFVQVTAWLQIQKELNHANKQWTIADEP